MSTASMTATEEPLHPDPLHGDSQDTREAEDHVEERPNEKPATEILPNLYTHAGDLEVELGDLTRRSPDADLSAEQIGRYNQILRDARALVPASVALREDVGELPENNFARATRVADVYRALHTTIVPTLHNALPEDDYDRRS